MDIIRPELRQQKTRRRVVAGSVILLAVALVAAGVSQIPTTAPSVTRTSLYTGTVTRGPMVRDVRAVGILTPLEMQWIAAPQQARVERVLVQPGAEVNADTPLIELTSPEIVQAALDAKLALEAAEAELASRRVEIESAVLAQESASAGANAAAEEAERRLSVEEELGRQGLTSQLQLDLARTRASELATKRQIEQRRQVISRQAADAQLAMARSRTAQLRAIAELRSRQRDALVVRAGIEGVVQQVNVQAGQQVAPGATLARVARPERLKAELKVPESQARDIRAGQPVAVDTRNGIVRGTVMRVDPGVQNGTVTVDVMLPEVLPAGARPDLTVDGTIQLERLENVLHVARPLQVTEGTAASVFRLDAENASAERIPVKFGRASANEIEIIDGLQPGDEIVLSDMSAWSSHERLKVK